MVDPTYSSSNESPEFFVMIQQIISSASFSDCLELVSEFNIPPFEGLDVCPPRHPRYIFFLYLGFMPKVPTALHVPIAYNDDLTRPIAICNVTYKFVTYPYNILQEFAVDNKVMVTLRL